MLREKLQKAVAEMGEPELDGFNPHFKSSFATLKSIKKVTEPALRKQGLRDWVTSTQDGRMCLMVSDGVDEMIASAFPVTIPSEMHKWGSAITYAERYLRMAAYALRGGEDDDGNAAMGIGEDPLDRLRALMPDFAKARGVGMKEAMQELERAAGCRMGEMGPSELQSCEAYMRRAIDG